jgi:hypothetical protein
MQEDPANNAWMPLGKVTSTHFARWFILDNLKTPEQKPLPPMIGFSSNFDGSINDYLNELLRVTAEGFDAICQHCEGYPEPGQRTMQSRKDFCLKNNYPPKLFWGSKFGHTVQMMRDEARLHDAIEGFIGELQGESNWRQLSALQIRDRIIQFVGSKADLKWALGPAPKPDFQWKVNYYGKISIILLLVILGLPIIIPFLTIWILIGRFYEKMDDLIRPTLPKQELTEQRYQDLVKMEDLMFQNQLTVYGTVKKPYWFKRTTLKLALTIFALNGAYRSTKGKLSGIPTIHFARWVIFNNDQNVMFLSNYNGNWENYLSEFIERSANAMNVSFGNMVGYPQVKWFIKGGAHDEQQFKALVRANQYPSQVYYSAYPYLEVRNILNNAEIRNGLSAKMTEAEAKAWLLRF